MGDLERFINDDALRCRPADQDGADPPPVREHPPVLRRQRPHRPHRQRAVPGQKGLLDIPVLYLSARHRAHKADYYRLLQGVRESGQCGGWEEWVLYLLTRWRQTAQQTIATVQDIKAALMDYKHRIRAGHKFYSQDLINNLFPPLHQDRVRERDLKVSRLTATRISTH
jgi:hypothetical protein